ncbi:aminotransferase class III-fold pyridoxal phosphate-dependent enzyme, partial [Listeria monocytogenes]
AAANAVLDIFENENILEKNQILSTFIQQEFSKLKKFDFLGNFRTCGMISAFDILSHKHERVGLFVFQKALEKGLLLRPLANTIY